MSYYECKRCGHITKQKIEMNRHLKRKNKCNRNINSYKYKDSELEKMSLIRHTYEENYNKEILDNEEQSNIGDKKNDSIINDKNSINNLKNKLNKNIENNINNNKFTCDICNKIFSRKYNLDRHKKICDFTKINNSELLINNNEINDSNDLNHKHSFSSKNTNNTTNNYNTINNNYNKNLFVNFNVEPFDNDWDVSRITKFTRHSILLSKIMYSNLLDNILQNEKNLNVVIQKDTNTGMVYKNNIDKFITMNMQEIIDKSMDKLNKHLKDFYTESLKDDEFVIMDKIFQEQIVNIENKYNEFKNNDEIKKKVEEFITQIYDKKKENALKLYNNTLLKNDDTNGF